ncbi:efflux RND transporter periplasmic adaptor subunit [Hydrocarboniphaga sp.]|uniref:efflux RND transporter periplasmic adaptor subunit n=1 Tax=Hydrocarboniphaga sp. TaxID=2033016 RepID=UPI003D0AB50F
MSFVKSMSVRYGAVAILVLFAGAAIKWQLLSASAPPQYLTAAAELGDVEQTVLATGTLAPSELVNVGAQVSGQVKTLEVKLGGRVAKGQVLAMIDSAPQENALRNAEAAVAQGRAQLAAQSATLKQSELALKRQAAILAAKLGTEADYEAAEAAADTARANIAATQAQITQSAIAVDSARVNLAYTKITSPIAGDVIGILVKQGQTVNAVQMVPTIVKVAKLDTMTVKAQISEADVIKLQPEQTVYFTTLGDPNRRYYAHLRSIEPAPESFANETSNSSSSSSSSSTAAVYYNALFEVANPERKLRTSMTVQVNVVIAQAKQVVTVASSALQPDADKPATAEQPAADAGNWATLRVVDAAGLAKPRRVKVGIDNGIKAQILDALAPGERVVISDATDAAAAAGQPKIGG